MDLSPTHEFEIPCVGYLENICSLNFASLPNLTFFIMQERKKKKNTHVLILPPVSSEKSKYWEAVKLRVADTGLP